MDFKKIINNVLGKTDADEKLGQAAENAGKAANAAVSDAKDALGSMVDGAKKTVEGAKNNLEGTVQDLLAKTDLDEKALAEVKGLLDKTDLDEKAMAMVSKLEGALNLPMVGDQIAKHFNMSKEALQAKIDAAKKAFNDVKNA